MYILNGLPGPANSLVLWFAPRFGGEMIRSLRTAMVKHETFLYGHLEFCQVKQAEIDPKTQSLFFFLDLCPLKESWEMLATLDKWQWRCCLSVTDPSFPKCSARIARSSVHHTTRARIFDAGLTGAWHLADDSAKQKKFLASGLNLVLCAGNIASSSRLGTQTGLIDKWDHSLYLDHPRREPPPLEHGPILLFFWSMLFYLGVYHIDEMKLEQAQQGLGWIWKWCMRATSVVCHCPVHNSH